MKQINSPSLRENSIKKISMSKILFRLNGVPEDEIEDVSELLTEHDIDFYETPPGNWGISMPAIWIKEEEQFDKAKVLLETYQSERSMQVKNEMNRLKQAGEHKTFIDMFKQNPVNFILHLMVSLLVIYLSIRLVSDLAQ